jgi:putative acetyltransferase
MPEVILKPISPADEEAQRLIARLNAFNLSLYTAAQCHLESPEQLINHKADMVGAYLGGRLTGIGALKQMNGYAEVKRMFVEQEHRGKGIAEKVLTSLEEMAVKKGNHLVRLETGSRHTAAIKFYTRMGYYRIRQFGDYPVNDVSVLMEKKMI